MFDVQIFHFFEHIKFHISATLCGECNIHYSISAFSSLAIQESKTLNLTPYTLYLIHYTLTPEPGTLNL